MLNKLWYLSWVASSLNIGVSFYGFFSTTCVFCLLLFSFTGKACKLMHSNKSVQHVAKKYMLHVVSIHWKVSFVLYLKCAINN